MKRILSVLLAVIMLCTVFAACNKKNETEVTVYVTINSGSEPILTNYEIKVKGEAPTALDAINDALAADGIDPLTTTMRGERVFIEDIDGFDTEDGMYLWELVINDAKKTSALTTEIKEGDKLVLTRNLSAITDAAAATK